LIYSLCDIYYVEHHGSSYPQELDEEIWHLGVSSVLYYYVWLLMALAYRRKCLRIEIRLRNREHRIENLNELIRESDRKCISELRMDRRTFFILCEMLRDVGGLKATRNMTLEEIVAQFVYTLSHHLKNRTIGRFSFEAARRLVGSSTYIF
jgi:hypothetical protein